MTVIESNSALSAVRETPACEQIRALVLDAVSSPATKRAYGKALDEFLAWCQREQPADGLSKAIVQRYRAALENRGLGASSVNIRMAAVRKLATEAADNGLLDAETARAIRSVHGVKMHGTRIGTWLSREQAQELLNAPDRETLKGTRDVALLAVLLGAGLRRSEVTALCVEDLQQREGRWVIMDIIGKGGRVRSVPIAPWVKAAIDRWLGAAGVNTGCVFRPVDKGGNVCRDKMTDAGVYAVLRGYAELSPHDARRTFAQLARRASCSIEQIQLSLGHSSIQTTERYLGTKQDLEDAPSDRILLRA